MFQLVFKGECAPGTDPETARNNARTLFKANNDQIARMFSGQPVVIRNRLEQVQAEKYRGVLLKHGMIAYVEPMEGAPAKQGPAPQPEQVQDREAPPARERPAAPPPAPAAPHPDTAPASSAPARKGGAVRVEPGDRLPVAGEKVDDILSGSGLTLDPVGITLQERKEQQAPMFEHLDEWTLAPPGVELVESRDRPPPVVPDVSHLSLEEPDKPGGR